MEKLRLKLIDWWFENVTLPQMERQRKKIFIILINRMLRKYRTWYQNLWHIFKPTSNWGVGYKYVVDNPKIGDIDWFMYFTFTTAEEKKFGEFAKRKLKKCYKYTYEKEYLWFHMMYGLRTVDEIKLDLNTLLYIKDKFGYMPDADALKEGYDNILSLIDGVKEGNDTVNTNLQFLDIDNK